MIYGYGLSNWRLLKVFAFSLDEVPRAINANDIGRYVAQQAQEDGTMNRTGTAHVLDFGISNGSMCKNDLQRNFINLL